MQWLQAFFSNFLEPMSLVMLWITGIVSARKTKFAAYRQLGKALRLPFAKGDKQEGKGVSSFGAAMTALAGTLGTGNMIGVGTAIAVGGAGALFWMVAAAFVGMSVKYTEIYLGCDNRVILHRRSVGGPMYYMRDRLHSKPMANLFAVCCVIAAFGIGNQAQVSAVGTLLQSLSLSIGWVILIAALFAGCLFIGMSGGEKRIGRITSVLTPFMAVGYLLGCLAVLVCHLSEIPHAVVSIFSDAFGIDSFCGGMVGAGMSGMLRSVKTGFTRGLFTNESGLGSAPLVHAASEEKAHTAGLWGVFEVFFDTVVMCSITGLTLLVGCQNSAADSLQGVFTSVFGKAGGVFLAVSLFCFALAAALSWGYYAECSLEFLANRLQGHHMLFRVIYIAAAFFGFFVTPNSIFLFADAANAVMLLLNTTAILLILHMDQKQHRFPKESKEIKRK